MSINTCPDKAEPPVVAVTTSAVNGSFGNPHHDGCRCFNKLPGHQMVVRRKTDNLKRKAKARSNRAFGVVDVSC